MADNSAWDEARLHLLATVMSPQLREHLMSTASEQPDGEQSVKPPRNEGLASEMESICRDAPQLISKETESANTCTVSDRTIQMLESIRHAAMVDRAECEKRLSRRQRFLKSMLLFDIVGSIEDVNPVIRLASLPGFTVHIEDVWDDQSRATLVVTGDEAAPEPFKLNPRTLAMLRKIVQPLADAKSAQFEFTSTGTCNMKLRGVPPAKEFLQRYPEILRGAL